MSRFLSPHRRPSLIALLLVVSSLATGWAEEQKPAPALQPFPDKTIYAAVGDSITHGGYYIHFINFFYATRFPHQKLTMFDCGFNGESAYQFLKRYPFDVAALHPNVVSVMYGMNDGGIAFYAPDAKFSEPLPVLKARAIEGYEKNIRLVIRRLLDDKIQVILITPSCYDETATGTFRNSPGYNATLAEIAGRARKVAQEMGVPLVDVYTPLQRINEEKQKENPAATIVGMDRVHPGPMGHLVMTYQFLKAQNVPGDVARFSINGTNGAVGSVVNCKIDDVKVANGGLTFRYSAEAIPFAVQHWYEGALKLMPYAEELNREIFQVSGLAAGNYELRLDGTPIRTWSAQELAAGVNVSAESKTPEYQQSQHAFDAYAKEIPTYARLRDIVTRECNLIDPKIPRPLSVEQTNQALDDLLQAKAGTPQEKKAREDADALRELKSHEAEYRTKIDAMIEAMRQAVQPKPHVVQIIPAAK
jgi:lysophospholipase L1-like esterase